MKFDSNSGFEGQSGIILRKASNSDAGEIARQNCIYFDNAGKSLIMPEEEEERGRITYMVESESGIIGKIKVDFGDEGFISAFGILPEYRRKGYGRKALREALNILNRNNIHKVGLEVAAQNKNALELYKSCGFEELSVTDYYEVKSI
jgi:ribosomal protein S18 acetylase RimI-like enzyme